MKKYITAFAMTQSMFCRIPFPMHNWDENSRPYMLLFLPLVGLEIGALWLLCHLTLVHLNIPQLIYALVMTVLPFVLTGFIHLDGFMDVTDAVCSCRDLEKRRAILKDSHVGSFAVVWCVILFIAAFVFFASAKGEGAPVLLFIPVISRIGSAMAVTNLKSMSTSQYANSHSTPKWHSTLMVVIAVVCLVTAFFTSGRYALCLVGQLAVYIYSLGRCYRSLQGMNGDISGFCITASEVCAVGIWALL